MKWNDEELKNKVYEVIGSISQVSQPPTDVGMDDDLFSSGTLDSIVLVGLLSKLESEFLVEVPPSEFRPENFTTIRGITTMVQRLLD